MLQPLSFDSNNFLDIIISKFWRIAGVCRIFLLECAVNHIRSCTQFFVNYVQMPRKMIGCHPATFCLVIWKIGYRSMKFFVASISGSSVSLNLIQFLLLVKHRQSKMIPYRNAHHQQMLQRERFVEFNKLTLTKTWRNFSSRKKDCVVIIL